MTVIDIKTRLTAEYDQYIAHSRSSDSVIYVDTDVQLDPAAASLDLTVGAGWFNSNDNRYYAIPDDGIALRPRESIVIETKQIVGVPLNAFGLVTGKGRFIFQGVFVSSGKIDPGFCDRLRIGLFNAGRETISIKKDQPFCTCCFFELETSFPVIQRKTDLAPATVIPKLPLHQSVLSFAKRHWSTILTLSIALASLLISIIKGP